MSGDLDAIKACEQERNGMSDTDDLRERLTNALTVNAVGAWFARHHAGDPSPDGTQAAVDALLPVVLAFAAEQSEPLRAALARVEALHQPYKVVDECDHDHTDEDIAAGRAYDTGFSYSCDDALLYVACTACCTDPYGDQTEMCADRHRHTKDGPICPTLAALSPAAEQDGGERP